MNILWFSWKDTKHPQAGGAETVSNEIMSRLVKDGHTVKLLTSRYPGSGEVTTSNDIEIHHIGSRFSVYIKARHYYLKHLKGWDDFVIDEMNTIPFLAGSYTTARRRVILAYQLARKVWFYQMRFPFSIIGYVIIEPILLRIAATIYSHAITESKSTVENMQRFGFQNINVFKVGINLIPVDKLTKKKGGLILSLGSVRSMKRTLDAIKAFEYARDRDRSLQMIIAGDMSSPYGIKIQTYIHQSRHMKAISALGRVSNDDRVKLMRKADIILVTSIKEGWGLIVTEANSQGTPAIVYNVDGLRDSVNDGTTGVVIQDGNPEKMGEAITALINDPKRYKDMREKAWQSSKSYTNRNSYKEFLKATGIS